MYIEVFDIHILYTIRIRRPTGLAIQVAQPHHTIFRCSQNTQINNHLIFGLKNFDLFWICFKCKVSFNFWLTLRGSQLVSRLEPLKSVCMYVGIYKWCVLCIYYIYMVCYDVFLLFGWKLLAAIWFYSKFATKYMTHLDHFQVAQM